MHEAQKQYEIRELTRPEMDEILRRNFVGRLAFVRGQRIEIQPVHYAYSDDWIYGRMEERGTKFEAVEKTHYRWKPVAFEVDEVEGFFRWRSVVVRGGFYLIPADGSPVDQQVRETAIAAMKRKLPSAFGPDDPGAFRTALFRIAVQEATGREASSTSDPLE